MRVRVKSEEGKSDLKKRKRNEKEKAPFYIILFIKRDRAQKAQLTALPSTSSFWVLVSCSKEVSIVTSARS